MSGVCHQCANLLVLTNFVAAFGYELAVHSNGFYGWDHGGYTSGVIVGVCFSVQSIMLCIHA